MLSLIKLYQVRCSIGELLCPDIMLILIMLGFISSGCCFAEGSTTGEMMKFKESDSLVWTKPNDMIEYIVPSPDSSTLGYLQKNMIFEGCEDRGCRILMSFGDKEIFFNKTLEEVYQNNKIIIHFNDIQEIKDKMKKACSSFLITLNLQFNSKGNGPMQRKEDCRAIKKNEKAKKDEEKPGIWLKDKDLKPLDQCLLIINTWQFNLLKTWLDAYTEKNLAKITLEKNNSITVDMGLMREFLCLDERLKHKMTLELESQQDGLFYCLTESHSDFLQGNSRMIEFQNLTECRNRGTSIISNIHRSGLPCLDWSVDISITLDLDKCNIRMNLDDSYQFQRDIATKYCNADFPTCILTEEENKNRVSPVVCKLNELRPESELNTKFFDDEDDKNGINKIKATKSTGKISTIKKGEMIYLEDSEKNLVCLSRQLKKERLGKNIVDFIMNVNYFF